MATPTDSSMPPPPPLFLLVIDGPGGAVVAWYGRYRPLPLLSLTHSLSLCGLLGRGPFGAWDGQASSAGGRWPPQPHRSLSPCADWGRRRGRPPPLASAAPILPSPPLFSLFFFCFLKTEGPRPFNFLFFLFFYFPFLVLHILIYIYIYIYIPWNCKF